MQSTIVLSLIKNMRFSREYIEIERTPAQQAMFVSAQSQLWIFALYELLGTWRQRIRKLRSWSNSGAIFNLAKHEVQGKPNLVTRVERMTYVQSRLGERAAFGVFADRTRFGIIQ